MSIYVATAGYANNCIGLSVHAAHHHPFPSGSLLQLLTHWVAWKGDWPGEACLLGAGYTADAVSGSWHEQFDPINVAFQPPIKINYLLDLFARGSWHVA